MGLNGADEQADSADFEIFALDAGLRLQRSLISRYGLEVGVEATQDCMVYAWQHWDRVRVMDNPVGYLWRVGRSSANRQMGWRRTSKFPPEHVADDQVASVDLARCLSRLRPAQRTCVLLVHAYGWSYSEVAEHLGVSIAAVTNHVHRGLKALRHFEEEIR
jgi:RNA polymerase sigma factor (sigma-70 family)